MKGARFTTMMAIGLLLACGRTGFDFPEDELADDGLDGGGDERGNGPGHDDGIPDEDEPRLPDPPLPESCGDGVAEPGELCFRPQVEFWSRIDPCALDLGDIDGDGHLDVVTPNSDFEHIESELNLTSVLYGNGQGWLGEPVAYITGDDIPVGVRLGDVNHDGGLDVISVNSDAGTLTVLVNVGQQQMVDAGRISAGTMPVIADVGDIDGDGVLDVAMTAADEVRVALGRGDGNFEAPTSYPMSGLLWSTRLLDVDRDGDVDMLVTNATDAYLAFYYNDGTGKLLDGGFIAMPGMPLGIGDADVDADGDLDLLIAHSFGLEVLLADAGGFEAVARVEAGVDPRDVAVADYDNDGRLDVAIVSSTSQDVTIASGRGDGQFDYRATYSTGTLPSGIEAGDFNEDGVPDLAVSNQLSNSIGLILSDP
ncbi:FG-GAP repeat domain-containing protein [Paraliomyxa miuraensis]|uniref:FG-GAP repeat domain-containing protein n=1 Tax=Paraliomyxa miuraensis TaxID=376150 RepID=UPI002251139F|nr:VCBS repeat-containing protein [Paraliomyxa miuraensis]MCX4247446.1 VCBS repeat-containing protein [Paraliomyxa miuraensis]